MPNQVASATSLHQQTINAPQHHQKTLEKYHRLKEEFSKLKQENQRLKGHIKELEEVNPILSRSTSLRRREEGSKDEWKMSYSSSIAALIILAKNNMHLSWPLTSTFVANTMEEPKRIESPILYLLQLPRNKYWTPSKNRKLYPQPNLTSRLRSSRYPSGN